MLNMYASLSVPGVSSAPFMVAVCPFVGPRYTVRCPNCAVVSMTPFDDGDALREGPLWKVCDSGHRFLVTLDDNCPFARFACDNGSSVKETNKKKARVGPSRTETIWDVEKVRERMGLVAPIDRRKPRPAPLQVPFMHAVDNMPPQNGALMRLVAAVPDARESATRNEVPKRKCAPQAYDYDDFDVDIDAALQTMEEIDAEMLEPGA